MSNLKHHETRGIIPALGEAKRNPHNHNYQDNNHYNFSGYDVATKMLKRNRGAFLQKSDSLDQMFKKPLNQFSNPHQAYGSFLPPLFTPSPKPKAYGEQYFSNIKINPFKKRNFPSPKYYVQFGFNQENQIYKNHGVPQIQIPGFNRYMPIVPSHLSIIANQNRMNLYNQGRVPLNLISSNGGATDHNDYQVPFTARNYTYSMPNLDKIYQNQPLKFQAPSIDRNHYFQKENHSKILQNSTSHDLSISDSSYPKDEESDDEIYQNQKRKQVSRKGKKKKTLVESLNPKSRKWGQSIQAAEFNSPKGLYRTIVKRRLRGVAWTMVYPKLLYWSVKNNAIKRKQEAHSSIDEKISWAYIVFSNQYSIEHITDFAGPELRNLLNDKKHDYIFVNSKTLHKLPSMGEDFFVAITSRTYSQEHIKRIMDRLITNTKKLTDEFFVVLAAISENGAVLPYDFMSMFELKRLQFTYFGILKQLILILQNIRNTTASKSKMILAGIVVLRIFLYKILMNARETLYATEERYTSEHNFIISYNYLGSFLILALSYTIALWIAFKNYPHTMVKIKAFYQLILKFIPELSLQMQLVFQDQLLIQDFFPKKVNFKIEKDTSRESEVIEGFYSKSQLCYFFSENPKWVKEIKILIRGWLDVLYENSHQFYLKKDNKAWKKCGTLTEL